LTDGVDDYFLWFQPESLGGNKTISSSGNSKKQ